MLGEKICQLEYFLFKKWIHCSLCKCFDPYTLEVDELENPKTCKRIGRYTYKSWYCPYFDRKEPLKPIEIIKHILKTVGNVLFIIVTLPVRPLLNMKAENEYLKEKCEELLLKEGR